MEELLSKVHKTLVGVAVLNVQCLHHNHSSDLDIFFFEIGSASLAAGLVNKSLCSEPVILSVL